MKLEHHSHALRGGYVLVFTSNSIEKKSVNDLISLRIKADIGIANVGCCLGMLNGQFILHVTGESGVSQEDSVGRVASALLRCSWLPKPSLILLVGICWGDPAKVSVGDVVVCSEILSLNVQHFEKEQILQKAIFLKSAVDASRIEQTLNYLMSDVGVRCHAGKLASSETLYKSDRARNQIIKAHPELLGGEMEAFAFLSERWKWLVVKAVSDYGGDSFSRAGQSTVANHSAKVLPGILKILENSEVIPPPPESEEALRLKSLISGSVIEIRASSTSIEDLSMYLDRVIGDDIEFKLRHYISGGVYGDVFVQRLQDYILEIAQNAIKYGRSEKVSVSFGATRVVVEDDGDVFDINQLVEGRGGVRAATLFNRWNSQEGGITVKQSIGAGRGGNKYIFELNGIASDILNARKNCALRVNYSKLGSSLGRPKVFEYNEGCKSLYLDCTRFRMSSRHYDLADAVRPLIAEGKRVYIGCRDEVDVEFYREELGDIAGENLVFFVDSIISR
ncbi:hypothetical protein QIY50_14030 [Pseudomonas putida]|nr:hypothetical protein QIY50_14030 [Pseudomonas putida]